MKARVIETGEIVDLRTNHVDEIFTTDGVRFIGLELDFDYQPDYWEKLKHQYVGMAMQGILANPETVALYDVDVAATAIRIANITIEKLKEEQK